MGVEFGNSSESTTSPTVGTECRPPGLKGDDVIYYVYKYTFVGILTVICLMGNALVIATLPRSRKFSRPSVYFIVSLACSDFMSGIIFPIYVASHIEVEAIQNTLGNWNICISLVMLVTLPQMASAYNLVLITAARFIAVKWPLRVNSILTRSKCIGSIVVAWTLATLISVCSYFRKEPVGYCRVCRYEDLYHIHHIAILLTLTVLVPLFIMIGLYCSIAYLIHSHARRIVDQNIILTQSNPNICEERPSEEDRSANVDEEKMTDRFGRFSLPMQFYSKNPGNVYIEAEMTFSTDTDISLPSQAEPPKSKGKKMARVTPREEIYKVDIKDEKECILFKGYFSKNHADPALNRRSSLRESDVPDLYKNGIRRTKSLSDLYKTANHLYKSKYERKLSSGKKRTCDNSDTKPISSRNPRQSVERIRRKYIQQEARLLRVVVLLLGYFTFAWLPFIIWVFVQMGCENKCNINRYIKATSRILLFSNSAINVFIYAGRHAGFRNAFQQQLHHVCCILRITCRRNTCCCKEELD